MSGLQHAAEAARGRLLRVLQLWKREVPAQTVAEGLLLSWMLVDAL
jgi:hypothetical protein